MNLSVLLIARNEEDKILKSLSSLNFANEIVVVLDRSTDNTYNICSKFTKNIHRGNWVCEGKRRNFGIKKCKSNWILEIDADEIVTKELSVEILEKIKNKNYDYFYIPILNYIYNFKVKYGWMACLAPDGKFCLYRKGQKTWKEGLVHPSYTIKGKKGETLKNSIQHFMSKNISELLARFNRNSSLYASELKEKKSNMKKLLSVRKIFSRFIKCYFSRKGFKSGYLGLLISILSAIYPFVSAIKSKEDKTISR